MKKELTVAIIYIVIVTIAFLVCKEYIASKVEEETQKIHSLLEEVKNDRIEILDDNISSKRF